ncbi:MULTISPECIES: thiamine-phosphate kinase [Arthrobacter]|uniref:Thiamine-monophosphate kinase n=2 Tax=Arthrobacter TaxID=1663 RepID=A0AAW8DF57_9MICC|nr:MULTISPECIES: thiamine-phosphate kinase [Arthrobacter]MDP9904905.1 thiamine-monophosphate kinase [Arthrobacter bambusae]MDQ0129721.1 thiamine-monophosphate kinase [Arthrobacter bambusae]MDQ0181101.1 thiamine-monophosphate kinase [Arthrobacter bambusae]MDQ0242213.1 thiamine-monophosphate kinase [Arthrobacter bambusae]
MSKEQQTVGELSEGELLARIFPRLNHSNSVLLGPGDDAAVVAAPDGRTLISIDTQTQDQDFRLEWNNGYRTTGYDVGWKSAAQNLSDINAMGGTAVSLVVSLTMPPGTPVQWVVDFADGLTAGIVGLGAADCSVAGGDLGRGREIAVTVAVVGTMHGLPAVLRSGARPGDILALAGTVGRAAAGLALLESTIPVGKLDAAQRALMDSQCRPQPPLAAGPQAAKAGATAMMDVSDGLLRDGSRLAEASGVALDLDPIALKALAAPLEAASAPLGRDPMDWILGGGEDHGLLVTFPADVQLPSGFTAIGSIQAVAEGQHSGVRIAGMPADTVGWDHFAD